VRCRAVEGRLSALVDGELPAAEAREVGGHLRDCSACRGRERSLRAALALVSELPRLQSPEPIAPLVRDRLEMQSRKPGLALVFRPSRAARPLILPSLFPAALVLLTILAGALALDQDPRSLSSAVAHVREDVWEGRLPAWGTEGNPLFPSNEVGLPRARLERMPDGVLASMTPETFFLETVVARDGTVSAVTLLHGDSEQAQPLLEALRRERFEPVRYRGRPVAVSVYRLISCLEVRSPLT
jgi:hypothetical protein